MHYTASLLEAVLGTRSVNSNAPVLPSYVSGQWVSGKGAVQSLVNPSTGEVVASCSAQGVDFAQALAFSRTVGGPALRSLNFADRAALLGKIADLLALHRDRQNQFGEHQC